MGDVVQDIAIVLERAREPDDDPPATITLGGGGQAANFCAWCAALGEAVRLVTRVGDDETGRRLVADLESRGVEVRAVWAAEPTGAIAVLTDSAGHRTMATQRGASVGLSASDLEAGWFRDAGLLHIPAYSLFLEPIAGATRAAIALVREAGGMLAVVLCFGARLPAYRASRMAYDPARMTPAVLLAAQSETATVAHSLAGLAPVPWLQSQ